ncbi:uncharacterized protein LOC133664999 [Entelurus aequoreus]|uniref:uncharacterized protein LOC133664999 n=1 Tax=Entelurus aequoreus TaxID=161455 RepID=UPI002B1E7442|nr:uncharacterized protein LOC133664999 [Entelurus aequoreus]XP_061926107.1 uncharacterized protein LOC133664999 [Entelurus aequoreus]
MHLEFCFLLLLSASSQTGGQSVALPPAATPSAWLPPAGTSGGFDLIKGRVDDVLHQRHDGGDDTTTVANNEKTLLKTIVPVITRSTEIMSQHAADSVFTTAQPGTQAAAPHSISPTNTAEGRAAVTKHPVSTFSSQNANTSTQPQSVTSWRRTTTAGPLTSRAGRDPAGPQHLEVPPELNVGDEELKRVQWSSHASLDPLLAGLLSVFIVTTAVVFIVLFLRFRQRTNHPEFHRLQDLPIDDLMEDTPLSRYAY